ncbi:MAG: hypothetical protein KC546_03270 [Anaerolineae bacterium]|nr:hypothetical protein [Anaerolineae bacterium]
MPSGNVTQSPVLGPEAIREALEVITHFGDDDVAFMYTSLVEERIQHPFYTRIARHTRRLHAMKDILSDVISSELEHSRRNAKTGAITEHSSEDAITNIQNDARSHSSVVRLVSFLFYRYLSAYRIESNRAFAEIINKTVRDIQRLQKRAMEYIADQFVDAEHASRQRILRSGMIAELKNDVEIVGRQSIVSEITRQITPQSKSFTLVSGAAGIGKTAVVCEAIRQGLSKKDFDALVWVKSPRSIFDIGQQIEQMLEVSVMNPEAFRSFTQNLEIIVVLDGAVLSASELKDTIYLLASCHTVMTSQLQYRNLNGFKRIILPDLPKALAIQLVHKLATNAGAEEGDIADAAARWAYDNAGGNPGQLQDFVRQYVLDSELIITNNMLARLLPRNDQAARQALITICIVGSQGLYKDELDSLDSLIDRQIIQFMVATSLVVYRKHRYYVEDSIIKLITSQIQAEEQQREVGEIIQQVANNLPTMKHHLQLMVADNLVSHRWRSNPFWDAPEFLLRYHTLARHSKAYDVWLDALLEITDSEINMEGHIYTTLAYVLRKLEKFTAAQSAAEFAIQSCGRNGNFIGMGWGMAESGAAHLATGAFEKASEMLQRSLEIAQRTNATELLDFVHSLFAELFFALGDLDAAAEHLAVIPTSWPMLLLQCDILIKLKRWNEAQATLRLLDNYDDDNREGANRQLGDVLILKGHFYFAQRSYSVAASYYRIASERFTLAQQFVRHARAITNTASCYLHDARKRNEGLRMLIENAKQQQMLDDAVGLAVTLSNLEHGRRLAERDGTEALDDQFGDL